MQEGQPQVQERYVLGGNWRLGSDDKPLIHYGHPSETVIFDMSNTTIVATDQGASGTRAPGSDLFFGGIVFDSGPEQRDNPRIFAFLGGTSSNRTYDPAGGGSRNVWFENTHRDYECSTTARDNAGIFWAPNPGGDNWRHYQFISRNRFEDISDSGCGVNWNGFYISKSHKLLEEHTVSLRTDFAHCTVTRKSTGMYMCHRNLDQSKSPELNFEPQMAGSYDPASAGPYELSYSRINRHSTAVVATAVFLNSTTQRTGSGRSTLPRSPMSVTSHEGGSSLSPSGLCIFLT